MNHLSKKLFLFLLFACTCTFLSAQSPCFTKDTYGLYDFPVPAGKNTVTITVTGADGGGGNAARSGSGGTVKATFTVKSGDIIRSIIGQAGLIQNNRGGGGGGTGVILCPSGDCSPGTATLLMVAGGGGGAGSNLPGQEGKGAVTTAGSGDGGSGSSASAGGGGINSNGGNGSSPTIKGGEKAFFDRLSLGGRGSGGYGGGDGFGGGGNNQLFKRAGGGGGGYTGGDGVTDDNGGNGGSNYIDVSGKAQSNMPGIDGGGGIGGILVDGSVSINCSFVCTPGALVGNDIGIPMSNAGSFSSTGSAPNRIHDVDAAGTGIGGTSDGFYLVHRGCAQGNIDIIARVKSIQNNADRQAGVMLRSTEASNSAHVALVINGKKQIKLLKRATDGGSTTTVATKSSTKRLNNWLRLTYNGMTGSVLAYYSTNGTVWNLVGFGTTITLPSNFLAGLVASRGQSGGTKAFSFDKFSINGTALRQGNMPILATPLAVKAFPNPAHDRLSVRVESASQQADWLIVNQMGQVVLRNQVQLVDGHAEEAIDIAHLSAGLYFLRVRAGEEVTMVKVVKE